MQFQETVLLQLLIFPFSAQNCENVQKHNQCNTLIDTQQTRYKQFTLSVANNNTQNTHTHTHTHTRTQRFRQKQFAPKRSRLRSGGRERYDGGDGSDLEYSNSCGYPDRHVFIDSMICFIFSSKL